MVQRKQSKIPQNDRRLPKPNRKIRSDRRHATEGDVKVITMLSSIGFPIGAIAEELGISKKTLERWVIEYPRIADAVKKGRSKRRERAYKCFFEQAFPITKTDDGRSVPTRKGDPSLMIFWMKTKERWKEPPKQVQFAETPEPPTVEFIRKDADDEET